VLLLDEADVYLERRSTTDVLRNGLVSVFLRSLEGIFFLTANRVHDFDEAVCSMVYLFLKYSDPEAWANQEMEHFSAACIHDRRAKHDLRHGTEPFDRRGFQWSIGMSAKISSLQGR
jgi:hypothetical protein